MKKHVEYLNKQIQTLLEQLPQAIQVGAPREKLNEICADIGALKAGREAIEMLQLQKERREERGDQKREEVSIQPLKPSEAFDS